MNEQQMHFHEGPSVSEAVPKVDFSSIKNIGTVLLYSALGILVTAAITFGLGYLFYYLFDTATEANATAIMYTYIILMIVSALGIFIIPFVTNFIAKKKAVAIWIPYMLYASFFGIFLSCFAFLLQPAVLGGAFLMSAIVFLVMGLIGYFAKGNFKVLYLILFGLLTMVTLGSVATLILWFVVSNEVLRIVYIALSVGILLYSTIVVIIDVNRIKKLTQTYTNQANLVFYSFILYTDYAYILLRILYFAVLIFGKRK